MTDEMECHACEREHANWTFDGQHTVSDRYHRGIIKRYECGHCGEITGVCHP